MQLRLSDPWQQRPRLTSDVSKRRANRETDPSTCVHLSPLQTFDQPFFHPLNHIQTIGNDISRHSVTVTPKGLASPFYSRNRRVQCLHWIWTVRLHPWAVLSFPWDSKMPLRQPRHVQLRTSGRYRRLTLHSFLRRWLPTSIPPPWKITSRITTQRDIHCEGQVASRVAGKAAITHSLASWMVNHIAELRSLARQPRPRPLLRTHTCHPKRIRKPCKVSWSTEVETKLLLPAHILESILLSLSRRSLTRPTHRPPHCTITARSTWAEMLI